jgi:hypothetical protein
MGAIINVVNVVNPGTSSGRLLANRTRLTPYFFLNSRSKMVSN